MTCRVCPHVQEHAVAPPLPNSLDPVRLAAYAMLLGVLRVDTVESKTGFACNSRTDVMQWAVSAPQLYFRRPKFLRRKKLKNLSFLRPHSFAHV